MQFARTRWPALAAGGFGILTILMARFRLSLAGRIAPPVDEWDVHPSGIARRLRPDGSYEFREPTQEEIDRFLSADAW